MEGSGVPTGLGVPSMSWGSGRDGGRDATSHSGEAPDMPAGAQGGAPAWREHLESPAHGWCWGPGTGETPKRGCRGPSCGSQRSEVRERAGAARKVGVEGIGSTCDVEV